MTQGPNILVDQEGSVKTLTIQQPHRKNAITPQMSRQLLQAVAECHEDDSRVIILRGSGEDFCAGADLDPAALEAGFDVGEFLRNTYNPLVTMMRTMDKVFVAQVRGAAVGVGFNFALACDLIYADESARFSQIFTRIGLSSDGGGSFFLYERLGYHRAFELLAFNEMLDAHTAENLGLVNRVVPAAELDDFVAQRVRQLAEGPFVALANTKANLRAARKGMAAALEQEAQSQVENFATEDFAEGIAAFLEKRQANWKGQ